MPGAASVVAAAKEETRSISNLAYSWGVFFCGSWICYLHLSSGWVLIIELLELRLGRQSPASWTDAIIDVLSLSCYVSGTGAGRGGIPVIIAGFPIRCSAVTSTIIFSAIVLVSYAVNSVSVEFTWRWEFVV